MPYLEYPDPSVLASIFGIAMDIYPMDFPPTTRMVSWRVVPTNNAYVVYLKDNNECYIAIRNRNTLHYVDSHWKRGEDYV
jgi:hypothetical protein